MENKKNTRHALLFGAILLCGLLFLTFLNVAAAGYEWFFVDDDGDPATGFNYDKTHSAQNVATWTNSYGPVCVAWQETTGTVDYIRVREQEGTDWVFIDPSPAIGLNRDAAGNGANPALEYYHGKIYVAWEEYQPGQISRIHVSAYDGSAWTAVDGGGITGCINYSGTGNAKTPNLEVFNNELYITWIQKSGSVDQVRVSKYVSGSSWSSVDGNAAFGLNQYTSFNARNPKLMSWSYPSGLYLCWEEPNSSGKSQIRVKSYNGSTWRSEDGGGSNGVNYNPASNAYGPTLIETIWGTMVLAWHEETDIPGTGIRTQIRLKKKSGMNPWTAADGGSGLNFNPMMSADSVFLFCSWDFLYITWNELAEVPSGSGHYYSQIRVLQYDGNSGSKSFIDGNSANGLNDPGSNGYRPIFCINRGLYAFWHEDNGSAKQIRAKKTTIAAQPYDFHFPAPRTYIIGENLDFMITYDKPVIISGGIPYIPITLDTGGAVRANYLEGSGTDTLLFRYTIKPGDSDTNGIFVGGPIVAPSGCTFKDPDGFNVCPLILSVQNIMVDGVAPNPPYRPTLMPASDTGISNHDNITSNSNPTFFMAVDQSLPSLDTNTVIFYDGTVELGSGAKVQEAGMMWKWMFTSPTLAEGTHIITAKAVDTAGNYSNASLSLTITIDMTPPTAPPIPDLTAGSDSGFSAEDNVTNINTPIFTGITEARAIVKLYDGETQIGSTTADSNGNWSITSALLAPGLHAMSVKVTDVAGNVSDPSPGLMVTIDNAPPLMPPVPDLDWGSDSGISNTDNITNQNQLTLTGAAEANSAVKLYDGTVEVGTGFADETGTWSITTLPLAEGSHTLTATATDMAGNISGVSSGLDVVIDNTAPEAPSTPDLEAGSDSGVSNTDNLTHAVTPTLAGTGPSDNFIQIYDGESAVGLAPVDENGVFSLTTPALSIGDHTFTARTTDRAGNLSGASGGLTVRIDNSAPVVTGVSRNSNTQLIVTFSEDCFNLTHSNNGGFMVQETGSAKTYLVTATSQGVGASQLILTVANMAVSGKEGVTVKYTEGGVGSIADYAGNLMATDNIGAAVAPWETIRPTIVSGVLDSSNGYLDITFSEKVYGAMDGTAGLTDADFGLIFTANGGTATQAVIQSVKRNDSALESAATALTGGETVIRVFLSITGNPSGVETIEIRPANDTAIYDKAGNTAPLAATTGGQLLYDKLAPAIVRADRINNTHLAVTLSEPCTNLTKTGNGGFTVNQIGAATITYAVTAIAQGADASQVILTVANMAVSGKEGVKVRYTAGANGTIQDLAGNAMVAPAAGFNVSAWDTTPPVITSGVLAATNGYLDITFSEGVYGASNGTGAIAAADLALTFNANGGLATSGGAATYGGGATNVTISSVKKNNSASEGSASALTGGETSIRVFLSVTGTPSGVESIEIKPFDGASIFDKAGNAISATETTGAKVLNDKLAPAIVSVARTDNTHLLVTLSENCINITKANDGGFTVNQIGNAAITYTVSAIAQGVDARHVILTVADMGASAAAGVKVKYTTGTNGTIQDLAGNSMATPPAGFNVPAW